MAYLLKLHRDVEKRLQRVPTKDRERLVETMRSLRAEPRPRGSEQLEDVLYRIRKGQYRIIYAVLDREVIVVVCKIVRRTEATYRDPQSLLDRAKRALDSS